MAGARKNSRRQGDEDRRYEMILADTSVWIKHFRESDDELITHLNIGSIACHPFIIGELACGNLGNRSEILMLLKELPSLPVVETAEPAPAIQESLVSYTDVDDELVDI